LIPEPQLSAERLTHEIFQLLNHPVELRTMSANARRLATPRAVQEIVDLIESVSLKRSAGEVQEV
jgi:UDP-N-acetylglucosamine:LPS N-acetylglucosamine transferase